MNRIPNIQHPSTGDIEYALEILDIPVSIAQIRKEIPVKYLSLHSILQLVDDIHINSPVLGRDQWI